MTLFELQRIWRRRVLVLGCYMMAGMISFVWASPYLGDRPWIHAALGVIFIGSVYLGDRLIRRRPSKRLAN